MPVIDKEYFLITCGDCAAEQDPNFPATFKMAKNKGGGNWWIFDINGQDESFADFLLHHSGCNFDNFKVEWL